MATVVLRLDARELQNPDLDLRYLIPDLLAERSGGAIRDDGYDYESEHVLAVFLDVDDAESALALIRQVLREEALLGNDLDKGVTVAIVP